MDNTKSQFENYSDLSIATATWDDLQQFCDFISLIFNDKSWQPKTVRAWMGIYNAVLYLMWHETQLVGSVMVVAKVDENNAPYSHLMFIAVHPEYRGRGLGEHMLRSIIDKKRGVWTLDTSVSNETAQKLYEKLGFVAYKVTSEKVHYRLQR